MQCIRPIVSEEAVLLTSDLKLALSNAVGTATNDYPKVCARFPLLHRRPYVIMEHMRQHAHLTKPKQMRCTNEELHHGLITWI